MTAVNNNTTVLPQALLDQMNGTSAAKKSTAEEAQDRFLTLLVTQMKNQDPLNPLDNAQVTSQLAQLSTVTGIDKLNGTLESMMGSYQSNQALQAANMIGHGVLAPGSNISLTENKGLMGVEFPQDVDAAEILVKDAAGNVIHTIDLGAHPAGTVPLLWDGTLADGSKAEDGSYQFEVKASLAGKPVSANALQFGIVTTVSTSPGGVQINVPGLGALNLADIRQIL
ncbi:Basal-body rod modification protein FlgD [Herminiimonas arsenicoxydans]|uniref:Basal-body rod modification protein FlgD n=1 Tax=Herminiimonas arsenicoxydans TaxID=204773 RepID=A4G6B2_HERAR|nr:Basal-body rod modification protein FlgD [Herminiimonas arsenicoxydans]